MSGGGPDAPLAPGLYFVATPLGNARDITLRALDTLRDADVLAAEDTRSLRRLMEIHGVPLRGRRLVAYHDHSGAGERSKLLAALADDKSVAYSSEAGSPLIADPGFALARDAREAGHPVFAVPGASAVIAALTVAGLPTDRFTFAGFPPASDKARRRFLEELRADKGTLILYESPKRLAALLRDAAETLGTRDAAVCRELTKKFEEVRQGTLETLADEYDKGPPRGEIVLCIASGEEERPSAEVIEAALRAALETMRLRDAAHVVADNLRVPKREVYQMALRLKAES